MTGKHGLLLATAFIGLLSPFSVGWGAEETCSWGESRAMGGHSFLTPNLVESSFVVSRFAVRMGGAVNSYDNVPFGPIGPLDIERTELDLGIELAIKVHDRIALQVDAEGATDLFSSGRTLLTTTGEYDTNAGGGVVLKLFRWDSNTQLSLRGHASGGGGKILSLVPFLTNVLQSPAQTVEEVITSGLGQFLLTSFTTFKWNGALALAQTLTPGLSLQGSLALDSSKRWVHLFDASTRGEIVRVQSEVGPQLGVALTGDAASAGVPLAAMLEYQLAIPRRDDEVLDRSEWRTDQILALGLYYSGRRDLQAGVVAHTVLGADPITGLGPGGTAEESDRPRIFDGKILLRYFW
jgi:hypothetical protein